VGGSEKIMDDATTDELQYSLKFLPYVSVVHLPDIRWGHQQDHIFYSTCSSWSATPWTNMSTEPVS